MSAGQLVRLPGRGVCAVLWVRGAVAAVLDRRGRRWIVKAEVVA